MDWLQAYAFDTNLGLLSAVINEKHNRDIRCLIGTWPMTWIHPCLLLGMDKWCQTWSFHKNPTWLCTLAKISGWREGPFQIHCKRWIHGHLFNNSKTQKHVKQWISANKLIFYCLKWHLSGGHMWFHNDAYNTWVMMGGGWLLVCREWTLVLFVI